MKQLGIAKLLLTFLAVSVLAQQPQQASITGTVADFATGAPLANVELRLQRVGTQIPPGRTDMGGAFLFANLAPGRYSLVARRVDYLDQAFGSPADSDYRGAPAEFAVAEGQRVEAPIRMMRGGTISGRIFDEKHAPAANVRVWPNILVGRPIGPSILGSIQPGGGNDDPDTLYVTSNDQGEYRMSRVPPGVYYLAAAPQVETAGRTSANNGATTYYPGFRVPDQAVSIKVAPGAELTAVNLTLEPASTLRVSGEIVNPLLDGQSEKTDFAYQFLLVPQNARIVAEQGSASSLFPNYASRQNEFELRNVEPGIYDFFAAYVPRPRNPREGFVYYVGRSVVAVSDRDVSGLKVVIAPGTDIPGQILLDDSARPLVPNLSSLSFSFRSVDSLPGNYAPRLDSLRNAGVAQDGTFVLTHTTPGRYFFFMGLNPRLNLYVAAIRLGTRDILGQAFELDANSSGPLVIEISGQAARVEGVVTDGDSQPVARARVVLIPSLEWRRDQSAYRVGMTDVQGNFSVVGLRPGRYDAYAFARIADGAWTDSQAMAQYGGAAVPVEVQRNGIVRRDLKVIPAP